MLLRGTGARRSARAPGQWRTPRVGSQRCRRALCLNAARVYYQNLALAGSYGSTGGAIIAGGTRVPFCTKVSAGMQPPLGRDSSVNMTLAARPATHDRRGTVCRVAPTSLTRPAQKGPFLGRFKS